MTLSKQNLRFSRHGLLAVAPAGLAALTTSVALMLATIPMASGQTATTTATSAAVHSAITTNHILPGQIRISQMNGAPVYDAQNRKIGGVKDIILDRDGGVAAVILDVGAFLGVGGRYVALPMSELKVSFDDSNKPRFAVDRTKEQLKVAQTYDLSEKSALSEAPTPLVDGNR